MIYKIADYMVSALAGALTAVAVTRWLPDAVSANMLAGMATGMLLAMVINFILTFILIPFLGAFEVMIPLHLVGMIVGMFGGMGSLFTGTPWHCIAAAGFLLGLGVAFGIARADKKLSGFSSANHVLR